MKTLMSILLLSSLMIAPILAAGADLNKSINKTGIVSSLNLGIKSDNDGLRTSSAIIIKQVLDNSLIRPEDFSSSLIPLLSMLQNGKTPDERIAAALALFSLDNSIAVYRLRGAAKFDNDEKVRVVSKNLYYFYHISHNSAYFLDF